MRPKTEDGHAPPSFLVGPRLFEPHSGSALGAGIPPFAFQLWRFRILPLFPHLPLESPPTYQSWANRLEGLVPSLLFPLPQTLGNKSDTTQGAGLAIDTAHGTFEGTKCTCAFDNREITQSNGRLVLPSLSLPPIRMESETSILGSVFPPFASVTTAGPPDLCS